MSSGGITPLTTGIVMFVFVTGVLFAVMFLNSASAHGHPKKKVYLDVVTVKNKTQSPQTVITRGNNVVIAPGETSRITIPSDSLLSINNSKLDLGGERINTIYITDTGISTNLTAEKGTFSNSSLVPVQLVEEGIDGVKRNGGFVGPGSKIKLLIQPGILWYVLNPEHKIVLGSLKTSRGSRGLLYDGEKLSEIK